MSRQDANAAFARTSFLYGGNADYIDELYARYEADPQAVDGQWRAFFESLKDDTRDVAQNAKGRPGSGRTGRRCRAATSLRPSTATGTRSARRSARRCKAKAQTKGVELTEGHVQQATREFGARPDADPRLPHARPSPRQSRSARPRAAQGPRGARPAQLRVHRSRSRPADLHRPRARPRIRHRCAQMLSILQRTYCQTLGRRVHAYLRSRSRRAGSRSASRGRTRRSASPARASGRSSTSSSRPKASRSSATSSSPAPSGSASTAANR